MTYEIKVELKYADDNITSTATGIMTKDNFEEIAEEIYRWFGRSSDTKVVITEVNKL